MIAKYHNNWIGDVSSMRTTRQCNEKDKVGLPVMAINQATASTNSSKHCGDGKSTK